MSMSMGWKRFAATVCVALSASSMAAAVDVAGVKFEETLTVGNAPLQLNGAGIRYLGVFKVLAAGLYLSKSSHTTEEALVTPGPKRMLLTFLRDVEASKVGREFIKGFGDNASRAEMSRLIPGLSRIGLLFDEHGKFVRGESLVVDWVPGVGAVVSINGVVQGEPFKEQEFFNTVMAMWIGKSPVDWRLKDALLGQVQ